MASKNGSNRYAGDASASANNFQSDSLDNPAVPVSDLPMNNNDFYLINKIIPKCRECEKRAPLVEMYEVSGTQIFWGCLLMCSLPCICWLPFCVGRCEDRRMECAQCGYVYDYYQPPMCPFFCWYRPRSDE